jgi:hypothetical protein
MDCKQITRALQPEPAAHAGALFGRNCVRSALG